MIQPTPLPPLIEDPEVGIWAVKRLDPVTFIHGDNMAYLRWCKDELMFKHFHVGVVDPQYGINAGKLNFGSRAADRTDEWKEVNRSDWDSEPPTREYWDLMRYTCRNLIVWGGNYFTEHFDWSGRCFIVWDKMNDKMSFAGGELALTDYDANAFIIRRPRNAKTEEDKDKERRHRTQKPVYLYDRIHLEFELKNKRVLDTHGGSHTHAIAAWKNGSQLTIIEKAKIHHDDGIEAYKAQTQKGRLGF